MARQARHVFVSGDVQGVGFRWHARERAQALGLAGWVRNLPDGRVEVLLEGGPEALEQMLAWLRRGPPSARVDRLEAADEAVAQRAGFEVRR